MKKGLLLIISILLSSFFLYTKTITTNAQSVQCYLQSGNLGTCRVWQNNCSAALTPACYVDTVGYTDCCNSQNYTSPQTCNTYIPCNTPAPTQPPSAPTPTPGRCTCTGDIAGYSCQIGTNSCGNGAYWVPQCNPGQCTPGNALSCSCVPPSTSLPPGGTCACGTYPASCSPFSSPTCYSGYVPVCSPGSSCDAGPGSCQCLIPTPGNPAGSCTCQIVSSGNGCSAPQTGTCPSGQTFACNCSPDCSVRIPYCAGPGLPVPCIYGVTNSCPSGSACQCDVNNSNCYCQSSGTGPTAVPTVPPPPIFCDPSTGGTTSSATNLLNSAIGCIPYSDTNLLAAFLLKWGLGIAGGIAFLLIVVAGFMITTSAGNPQRLKAGQELLGAAIEGVILLIFAVLVLRLIGQRIFGIL